MLCFCEECWAYTPSGWWKVCLIFLSIAPQLELPLSYSWRMAHCFQHDIRLVIGWWKVWYKAQIAPQLELPLSYSWMMAHCFQHNNCTCIAGLQFSLDIVVEHIYSYAYVVLWMVAIQGSQTNSQTVWWMWLHSTWMITNLPTIMQV